jgi:glycine cleavage system H protein
MPLNISKIVFLIRRHYSVTKDFYTKNHEWIKLLTKETNRESSENNLRARIGITDYSQKALGDIVFIEMPKTETNYNAEGMN